MTQARIDRATLEQLLEDVLQINREIGKGGAACDISNRACPPIKRSLDALRAAIAGAERVEPNTNIKFRHGCPFCGKQTCKGH